MQNFEVIKKTKVENTYRNNAVTNIFDLQIDNEIVESIKYSIDIPDEWNIGVIVGASGTGKTTLIKEVFQDKIFSHNYDNKRSVVDNFKKDKDINDIVSILNQVGFSSPPSWLKTYDVLSNGEKMRVDLAMAVMSDNDPIIFDEYTSVVNRDVAKVGSLALQKYIRKNDKKFIAVSCHYDIIDWIMPDWIYDTNNHKMIKSEKKNQKLKLEYLESKIHGGIFLKSIII